MATQNTVTDNVTDYVTNSSEHAPIGAPEDLFVLSRVLSQEEKDELLCLLLSRAEGLVDALLCAHATAESEWHWETTPKLLGTLDMLLKQAQIVVLNVRDKRVRV